MSTNGLRRQQVSKAAAGLAVVATLGLSSGACSRIAELKGMMRFKEANAAYQSQNYTKAAELYEETIANDPSLAPVYFFLGNSYDNQYKPGMRDPENDAKLAKAVENYEKAAERLAKPEDAKLKMLTLQYLAAAYGSDKLDDPAKAEPVLQRIIELDPTDPASYLALAKLYEDAGAYSEAEEILLKARDAKPNDPGVYVQLGAFYNRQGEFAKTIAALEQRATLEPTNPEAFFTISTYYWDNAQRNLQLKDEEKRGNVAKGLTAVDQALKLRPDYMEALVYKGLLLRVDANLEKNPARQQALIKEATELQNRAEAIRKQKVQGLAG